MNFMDIFDMVMGPLDLIDLVYSTLRTMGKGGVTVWYARPDKWKGKCDQPTGKEIRAHLKRYGVPMWFGPFNVNALSYKYNGTQKKWHDYLVREVADSNSPTGKRIVLHHPNRAWADGPERREKPQGLAGRLSAWLDG